MNQATLNVWDDDACRRVHEASLTVLARTGVDVKDDRARELYAAAGAAVDGRRVRIPGELVEQALASAPRTWTLRPRGGETAPLELRDGAGYLGSGPDCLYVTDPDTGERRRARLADVEAAARVVEALPNIDFAMSMALPADVANEVVDVTQFAAMLRGTRKPIVVSSPFGGETVYTMHAMAAACGEAGSFACLAMTSPPLQLDDVCCTKALACADLDVPLVLAPSVSAGAQGPASLAACVAVANAEVLAGLVVHQLGKAGAPFVMGVGAGVMNMQSAVDVYNAPGVFLGNQAQLDLIRWYGLPSWHYAGHSDSKSLDEQWALELGVATIMGALSRATLLHDVGYLESGLQSALEGLVLGDEVAGYARALLGELPVDDEALALAEIEAAGPGGNHLATKMTRRHFRDFWRTSLIDQSTYDRWSAAGGPTLLERVRARVAEIRAAGPAFTLDDDTLRQIDAWRPGRPGPDRRGRASERGGDAPDARRGRRGPRQARRPSLSGASHHRRPPCRYPSSPAPSAERRLAFRTAGTGKMSDAPPAFGRRAGALGRLPGRREVGAVRLRLVVVAAFARHGRSCRPYLAYTTGVLPAPAGLGRPPPSLRASRPRHVARLAGRAHSVSPRPTRRCCGSSATRASPSPASGPTTCARSAPSGCSDGRRPASRPASPAPPAT